MLRLKSCRIESHFQSRERSCFAVPADGPRDETLGRRSGHGRAGAEVFGRVGDLGCPGELLGRGLVPRCRRGVAEREASAVCPSFAESGSAKVERRWLRERERFRGGGGCGSFVVAAADVAMADASHFCASVSRCAEGLNE